MLDGLAAEQAGLVTAAQAGAAGVDRVTQLRLADAQLLERAGRGVYRVAGAEPPEHLEIRAAWLRLDPVTPAWQRDGLGDNDGVVSHRSACLLHRLGDIPAPDVELTVPRRRTTREPGVRLLMRADLEPADVTIIDGLPVTTVERTVADLLREHADGGHVGGVLADADRRGALNLADLAERVHGLGGAYGVPRASGRELLSRLVAMAGRQLEEDRVQQVATGAALVGVTAGYDQLLHGLAETPAVQEAMMRIVREAMLKPGLDELRAAIHKSLAPNVAALSSIGEMVAAANSAALEPLRALAESFSQMYAANLAGLAPLPALAESSNGALSAGVLGAAKTAGPRPVEAAHNGQSHEGDAPEPGARTPQPGQDGRS